jgi:hypothetical protein
MNARAVAENYAQRHGMAFSPKEAPPFRPPSLGGSARCVNAIRGAVADGPTGVVCQLVALRGPGLPSAQYEVSGLGDVIEGLWVRKSGRSVWTRVALPRGYSELMVPSEAFTGRYRVAISCDRDEDFAAAAPRATNGCSKTDRQESPYGLRSRPACGVEEAGSPMTVVGDVQAAR